MIVNYCIVITIALFGVEGQSTIPYKLTPDQISDTNVYKLQCKDSNGLLVPDAIFLRNGAINNMDDDDCFNKINDTGNGYIQLLLTSECDGRYMCGINNNNGYILSGPTMVFG